MSSILNNYFKVKENIAKECECCSRNISEITLVTVTKKQPLDDIMQAYQAGCRDFGENRLNEALLKIPLAPNDINWHMIGTLQKNKVKKSINKFALIHSVDGFDLAQKISSCSLEVATQTPVLLQVNTSGEITKHGLNEEGWRSHFEDLLCLPGISLQGLMTMAPRTNDEKLIRNCFARLRNFREDLAFRFNLSPLFKHLSMGMSEDYCLAIREGATLLRIGTAIFHP